MIVTSLRAETVFFAFLFFFFFFFNDTATTEIYTLSLHDALRSVISALIRGLEVGAISSVENGIEAFVSRSEEHTSELQSLTNLVYRLLLEKNESLPRWAKAFDVAIVPYRRDRFVFNSNPLKNRD